MGQDNRSFQPDHREARNSARFWVDGTHPNKPFTAFEFTNLSTCYLELSDALKVVHSVRYASQPYVYFHCTEEGIHAGAAKKVKEGVFEMEEGSYTFDEEPITCADCLRKLRQSPRERFARWLVDHPGADFSVTYGEEEGDPTIVTVRPQKGNPDELVGKGTVDEAYDQIMKEFDKRLEELCARIEAKVVANKQKKDG
jgi:hypothetical protein